MARIARVVVPECPHHVTQRGNRRQRIFFQDADYVLYRGLIATSARKAEAEVWSYCFMPNHVHLIVTPSTQDGLRATFAEAHRRYTGGITVTVYFLHFSRHAYPAGRRRKPKKNADTGGQHQFLEIK